MKSMFVERSTIVSMAWLYLSTIKSISKSLKRFPPASSGREWMLVLSAMGKGLRFGQRLYLSLWRVWRANSPGMDYVVDTLMWNTDTFLLKHARYLSQWALFFYDELFDSPHQFRGKSCIASGTLATCHSLCMRLEVSLPYRVGLCLNSWESADWLIPTICAISFLGHFLCSKAKICDLCSEVSCLYMTIQR